MPILIECPACRTRINAPDAAAGRQARCPKCGQLLQVPVPVATQIPVTRVPRAAPLLASSPTQPPGANPLDFESEAPGYRGGEVRRGRRQPEPFSGGAAHSLGIASMVLGIVSLPLALIPCIGFISLPLSGLGLLLGAVGLFVAFGREGRGVGFPIAGGAISGLSVVFGLFWLLVLSAASSKSGEGSTPSGSGEPETLAGIKIGDPLLEVVKNHDLKPKPLLTGNPWDPPAGRGNPGHKHEAVKLIGHILKPALLGIEDADLARLELFAPEGNALLVLSLDNKVRAVIARKGHRASTQRGISPSDNFNAVLSHYSDVPDLKMDSLPGVTEEDKDVRNLRICLFPALGVGFEVAGDEIRSISLFPPVKP